MYNNQEKRPNMTLHQNYFSYNNQMFLMTEYCSPLDDVLHKQAKAFRLAEFSKKIETSGSRHN